MQTSNLVHRFRTKRSIQKLQNYLNWGTEPGSRDLHLNFGPAVQLCNEYRERLQISYDLTVYAICTLMFVRCNKTATFKYKKPEFYNPV